MSDMEGAFFQKKESDDYDWNTYHALYRQQFEELSRDHTVTLSPGDYVFRDGKLLKENNSIKDMLVACQLVCEIILKINPESVVELGCGSGLHLCNLHVLNPNIQLNGLDIGADQIKFVKELFPNLPVELRVLNGTIPITYDMYNRYELCYTNYVIMHIHEDDSHLIALANLFNMAKKYVVLSENWTVKHFINDINMLLAKRMINWDQVHFHTHTVLYDGGKEYVGLICSKEKLPNFPELTDYNMLLKNPDLVPG